VARHDSPQLATLARHVRAAKAGPDGAAQGLEKLLARWQAKFGVFRGGGDAAARASASPAAPAAGGRGGGAASEPGSVQPPRQRRLMEVAHAPLVGEHDAALDKAPPRAAAEQRDAEPALGPSAVAARLLAKWQQGGFENVLGNSFTRAQPPLRAQQPTKADARPHKVNPYVYGVPECVLRFVCLLREVIAFSSSSFSSSSSASSSFFLLLLLGDLALSLISSLNGCLFSCFARVCFFLQR
jgi:hypothetical protein